MSKNPTYLSSLNIDAAIVEKAALAHDRALASAALKLDDPRARALAIAMGIERATVSAIVARETATVRAEAAMAGKLASAHAALALTSAQRTLLESARKALAPAPKVAAPKVAAPVPSMLK